MEVIAMMLLGLGLSPVTTIEPAEVPTAEQPAAASEPTTATTGAQPADPLGALVEVRVEIEDGESVAALLHTEIVAALAQAQVDPQLPERAPLVVTVSPDAEGLGSYEVVMRHRGEALRSWTCPCSGDELRARLAQDAVDAWHELVAASAEASAAPASLAPIEPIGPAPGRSELRFARGSGSRIAGIASTTLGTALVVGTAALLAGDAAAQRGVDPPTLAVLGGGTALLVTGITLWSVGAHQRKHPRLTMHPTPRSRGAVMTVAGSF